jgi:hypothetical protein
MTRVIVEPFAGKGPAMTSTRFDASPLRFASLLLGLLGLAGCDPNVADESEVASRSLEDGLACPAARQLIRMPEGVGCIPVPGWTKQSMLPNMQDELGRYCVYRWNGGFSPSPTVLEELDDELLKHLSTVERTPDCEGMLVQTEDELTRELGPTVADNFLGAVGALDSSDLNAAEDNAAITVAVIDTSPTCLDGSPDCPEPSVEPNSPHGEAMVDIIETLACPDPDDCAVAVRRVLGLPRIAGNVVDLENGGYVGSQSDLARAIVYAVEHIPGPLIINLSVGWEPWVFGNEIDSVGAQAVLAAIEYARCRGVILVAAAGNDGGQGTLGPLLPGGWELRAAPSQSRCEDYGIFNPVLHTGGSYRPLVYSVGGLRYEETPMIGSREYGLPRLVATATHANVGTEWTLTGTSVSTAAVSAAAALIWSHFSSDLDGTEVMDLLYSSGHDLEEPADYSLVGSGNFDMHRLDICEAFADACGPSCAHTQLDCQPNDAAAYQQALADILDGLTTTDQTPASFTPVANCGFTVHSANANQYGCPAPFDPDVVYTRPQPPQPGCPTCTIKKPGNTPATISMSLDPFYASSSSQNVTLTILDGTSRIVYRLGQLTLSPTSVTQVTLTGVPATMRSATIEIDFDVIDGITGNPDPVSNELIVLSAD